MKKLLIAFESPLRAQQLEQNLSGLYHIVSCNNGLDCLETIKDLDPDILVLDLMLSGIDGVSLLEHAWNGGYRPKVIAISAHISDYIVTALERINICCLLRYHGETSQLAARIIDVDCGQGENIGRGRCTANILMSLGFRINTSGCRITMLALEFYARNPSQKITSELYPAVAAACGGTVTQVEKAIRDSIESAWKEHNEQVWKMYFHSYKNGKLVKPTNGKFLERISFCISDCGNTQDRKIG